MEKEELLELFKYYKEEGTNPYAQGTDKALWWEGEKVLYDLCTNDAGRFERIKGMLERAIKEGHVSKPLDDEAMDINKRTVIFFLDLWHGKWYPYDDLDRIFTY